jgi:hypothetical protein
MAFNQVTNLDFEDVKQSLREFMRSSETFTDYNFEGSVLSQFIDVLAYNTYYSALNANLVANEVFLDSASIRENVVSLAKSLGYVPRGATAPKATVTLTVPLSIDSSVTQLTLKRGSALIGKNDEGSFVFTPSDDVTKQRSESTTGFSQIVFENLDIFQATPLSLTYTVNNSTVQKFIIPDSNADLNLIEVKVNEVSENNTAIQTYKPVTDITTLTSTQRSYFIQENKNEQYEIIFGDDTFGRKLKNNDIVTITYFITDKALGNDCNNFNFTGRLFDQSNNAYSATTPQITVVSSSSGGSDPESVTSIKYLAPRSYSAQNRAVTVNDYEFLVNTKLPGLESLTVFGGEDASPPQYGKVFVAAKPFGASKLTTTAKLNLIKDLRQFTILTVVPEIVDPSFLYIDIDSYVYYNSKLTKKTPQQIATAVRNSILQFGNTQELNKFNSKFKYSKLISFIDEVDPGITSNITRVRMEKRLETLSNIFASYEICYGNRISPNTTLISNGFKITGEPSTYVYFFEKYDDNGTIAVFRSEGNVKKYFSTSIGNIDYEKGEININNININSVVGDADYISLSVTPASNDILGLRDLYLLFDSSNVNVNVILDELSSSSRSTGVGQIPVSS